jgi:hypothetical protein
MSALVLAATIASWAADVFTVACTVAVGVLFPLAVGVAILWLFGRLADELKQLRQTVEKLENDIRDFRATTLPPVAVALGSIGAALAGAVSPWVGMLATAAFTVCSYYFANLAKTRDWGNARKYLAVAAAILPFAGAAVGSFVIGDAADLSSSRLIGFAIFAASGLFGMILYVIEVAKREAWAA